MLYYVALSQRSKLNWLSLTFNQKKLDQMANLENFIQSVNICNTSFFFFFPLGAIDMSAWLMFLSGTWSLSGHIESCYPYSMARSVFAPGPCVGRWTVLGLYFPDPTHQKLAGEGVGFPAGGSPQLPMEALSAFLHFLHLGRSAFAAQKEARKACFLPWAPKYYTFFPENQDS